MDNKQQAAKIRQLQKDLDEQDLVNASAGRTIDELRSIIDGYKETIAMQRRVLALQAGVFSRIFNYTQDLNQQMQATVQDSKNFIAKTS
jgi:hypothetical protein